jgi:hypothetical protein
VVWLDPDRATLTIGAVALELPAVTLVAVDRRATRVVVEHGPAGPHPAFVDAPEQRVDVRLVRRVQSGEAPAPALRPGALGTLEFRARAAAADVGGRSVTVGVVVVAVEHELDAKRGLEQTIQMIGVSPDGAADPVTEGGAP